MILLKIGVFEEVIFISEWKKAKAEMEFQKLFSQGLREISTQRLRISPLKETDYEDLEELYSDPSSTEFDASPILLSKSSALPNSLGSQLSLWIEGSMTMQVLVLGFRMKANQKLIGYRLLRFFSNGSVYTEVKVNKNFRGTGLATEGSRAIFNVLLRYGASQIFTTVHKENGAAFALDRKLNLSLLDNTQYPLDGSLPPSEFGHINGLIEFYPLSVRQVFAFFRLGSEAFSLFSKARLSRRQGDISGAKVLFERSLVLEPNYIYSLDGAGWSALDLNMRDLADQYFTQALAVNKHFARSLLGKAYVLADSNRTIESIDVLMNYLEFEPEDDETYVYLGTLFYKVSYIPEAAKCFERALEVNPSNQAAKQSLSVLKNR